MENKKLLEIYPNKGKSKDDLDNLRKAIQGAEEAAEIKVLDDSTMSCGMEHHTIVNWLKELLARKTGIPFKKRYEVMTIPQAIEHIEKDIFPEADEETYTIHKELLDWLLELKTLREKDTIKERYHPLEEVYPNKGESKKDFIARFMKVTKDEYPDVKQRYDVANSYWDRRNKRLEEAKRSELISKSKGSDKYKGSEDNRWTRKSDASIANTVKDYNKIDMDTFWKEDKLTFGVKVKGKTSDYLVHISFNNIFENLQTLVKSNKNKLTPQVIYKALLNSINSGDVKINCTCPDYSYRLRYFASKNGYNQGKQETRISKQTNPDDSKGSGCKHIMAVLNNLEWLNKIASVINNYVNYMKDNMENNYARFIFPKIYGMTYEKAVQLTVDDFDDKGNLKDKLDSSEDIINLANALGKLRGRFKKKS